MPSEENKITNWPLLAALVAAAVMLAALIQFAVFLVTPAGKARSVIVRIYPGASLGHVAQQLQAQGVVTSAWRFRWLARVSGKAANIKAGEYDLSPSLTPGAILDLLAKGKVRLSQVTIPEGYTMAQVADALQSAGLADADRFIAVCSRPEFVQELGVEGDTLEGYLFPDTYNVPFFMTEEAIARKMVQRFLKTWERYAPEAEAKGWSMKQVVTLASIIEKETSCAKERPLISAVFHNRLRRGMPLQSDPTVIYGLQDFDGNLTRRDLHALSPYNTYVHRGLPPGPISNPGEAAIKAALEPARCKYLYFVSKNDGRHQFSCTLAEHNHAVAVYQKHIVPRLASPAAAEDKAPQGH